MRRWLVIAAIALLSACGADSVKTAPDDTGTVHVTVTDTRGARVIGASVTVSSTTPTGRTSFTKPTDTRGEVTFTELKSGSVRAIAVADAALFGRSERVTLPANERVELQLIVQARP